MLRSAALRRLLGIATAAALTGCASLDPGAGAGGSLPGHLEIELGYGSGGPIELPQPAPDVGADTARALREIESRRKADALGRDQGPETAYRPDLDRDVTQGIESRGLDRAIGR